MTVLISKTKTLKLKLMFKRDFGPKHDIALSKKIKNQLLCLKLYN